MLPDDFFKVHVEVREEKGYDGEPPTYTIITTKNNHGSSLHPPLYDREMAEVIANNLQIAFDAEQDRRHKASDDNFKRHEAQQAERVAREKVEWENARVVNVGDGWGRSNSTRHGEQATVVEFKGHKIKVRYDDGRVVTSKRSNFEIVR